MRSAGGAAALAAMLVGTCGAAPAGAQLPPIIPPGSPPPGQNPPPQEQPPQEQPPQPPPPPSSGGTSNSGTAVNHRGSVARTSYVPGTDLVPPLEVLWSALPGGEVYPPVIADGRVFAPATRLIRGREFSDDRRPAIVAVDALTGKELWSALDPGGVELAYDQGRLFVGGGLKLRAFDAATGAPLWTVDHSSNSSTGLLHPVASDGFVYVADNRNRILAFDAASGQQVWAAEASEAGQTWPALHGGKVFGTSGCSPYAFDARTGSMIWSGRTGCSTGGSAIPAVQDGRVFQGRFAEDGGKSLDAETGRPAGPDVPGQAYAPGVGVAQGTGVLTRSLADAKELWFRRFDEPPSSFDVGPVVTGNTVWALDSDGVLRGYGMSRGDVRESITLYDETTIISSVQDVSLASAEGFLAVPASGRIIMLRSAIPRPAPAALGTRLRFTDIAIGQSTRVDGRVGDGLAGQRLQLQADPYPYGHFAGAGATTADPADGTFRFKVRPRRNTRYRVRAASGALARAATAYVAPSFGFTVRDTGGGLQARVRLRGAPGVRLSGHRVFVYLLRRGKKTLERLGGGPLRRAGRNRAQAAFGLRRVRAGSKDLVFACVTGLRAMGRQDRLAHRCGAARIRAPR